MYYPSHRYFDLDMEKTALLIIANLAVFQLLYGQDDDKVPTVVHKLPEGFNMTSCGEISVATLFDYYHPNYIPNENNPPFRVRFFVCNNLFRSRAK
jgi:hypothetical protein